MKDKEKGEYEGKRREEKRIIILPDFVDKSLWEDFLLMRKKIKKPATDRAQELLIEKLSEFKDKGHDVKTILKQSIENSWQGFYEPKKSKEDIYL